MALGSALSEGSRSTTRPASWQHLRTGTGRDQERFAGGRAGCGGLVGEGGGLKGTVFSKWFVSLVITHLRDLRAMVGEVGFHLTH